MSQWDHCWLLTSSPNHGDLDGGRVLPDHCCFLVPSCPSSSAVCPAPQGGRRDPERTEAEFYHGSHSRPSPAYLKVRVCL